MQLRAQAIIMFWPGMSRDIEKTRASCNDCNRNTPSQVPLTSEPAVPPSTPFEQIFADFYYYQSPRNFFCRYYLSSAVRVCVCLCVCMCVCLCDLSHTVQPRTFKF